jgi:nicotinate dehydrogenase subunit B
MMLTEMSEKKMRELLGEKTFSRKSLLKGGALVVGFSLAGPLLAPGKAQGATSPFASNGPTNLLAVDSFIVIHADNTASILTGGTEHGQGSSTGWLMLAGEELDMDMSQLKFFQPDTNVTPLNIGNYSSQGIKYIGPQVRTAAAYARQALLQLASVSLGVPVANLTVQSGIVSGGGKLVKYGDLIGDKLFNVTMPATGTILVGNANTGTLATQPGVITPVPSLFQGVAPTKSVDRYRLVGTRVPRIDIPAMVAGNAVYVTDIRVPGMLHGRIVLPRGQAAYGFGAPVVSVDESSIKHIPGARVVRRNDFVGVVAEHEYDAIQAAVQLKVKWADPPAISGDGNLWSKMRADDSAGKAPAFYATNIGDVDTALKSAANVLSQTYSYHYRGHMPIGPGCTVADCTPNGALIMTHTQATSRLRGEIARLLGLPEDVVHIKVYPGSSHYGEAFARNEGPIAAAAMSQLAGKPVRLQLMRWDEHGWDNYGPAYLMDLRGSVDAKGNIVAFDYTGFSSPLVGTRTPQQLLGLPFINLGRGQVDDSASGQQYEIPNRRLTGKTLPLLGNYFKTSQLRSTSQPMNFGTEIFMDELAYAAGMDPIAFRRQNVSKTYTDRLLGVLNALAQAANWQPRVAASNLSRDTVVSGRGIAVSPRGSSPLISFAGAIADIEVNKKTGKIVVKHVYAAQDQGLAVAPAQIENQIVGQVVQATSHGLLEMVRFDTTRVTSLDWVSYPILRFKDSPKVTPIVVQRTDQVMSGAGDYVGAQVPNAIANAFFDATGVRIREAPMTPARVHGLLKAASVA